MTIKPERPCRNQTSRAFTLVEMLTVLAILAIVIAIIIPAMNMARRAAKNADTRVLLTDVGRACTTFQNDQKKLPGYFSARAMGATTNGVIAGGSGQGFTTMDNIMLDLLGGVTQQGRQVDGASQEIVIGTVGPGTTTATQVNVDFHAMGSTTQSTTGAVTRNYLAMDNKRFVKQGVTFAGTMYTIDTPRTARLSTSPDDHFFFPALVDAFGQPILAWAKDEIPRPTNGPNSTFSQANSGANEADFYWAQNAGFLCATKLGKLGEDQTYSPGNKTGSIIGKNAANAVPNLEALLGNPSNPDPVSASTPTPHPLTGRAPIVLQSAGADGIYLSAQDKGGRSGTIQYRPNQDPMSGVLFDDLTATGGN